MDRESFQADLACALKDARQHVGWSLRELSNRAQVSCTTICHIEKREVIPNLLTAKRLADALSVSIDSLCTKKRE